MATKELWLSGAVLVVTATALVLFVRDEIGAVGTRIAEHHLVALAEQAIVIVLLAFLVFGNVVYQLERIGFLGRLARHRPATLGQLAAFESGDLPGIVTLVPSYREEGRVVLQTLLSAALQRYPNRVVLLIDDPPSKLPEHRDALAEARLLPGRVQEYLAPPARRVAEACAAFHSRVASRPLDRAHETQVLAELWSWVGQWFEEVAAGVPLTSHTDAFFIEHTLRQPALQCARHALGLRSRADQGIPLKEGEFGPEFTELGNRFACELTSFERKGYVNLSHEPNKAMNLNTYLGLIGGSWCETLRSDGVHLVQADRQPATLTIPDATYVLTVDADSVLAPDYALRLTFEMERPGNDSLAVIQTPYCAIPGPPDAVERIAGATTDIQHLLHQGSTGFGATFWVGANALLRRLALEDIRTVEQERGFPVVRYIQDRTVIEDTESSIDLVRAGWRLYNYPDRLAVSATPPDFGALIIQRRRWANGGLIILPKLIRYLLARPLTFRKLGEATFRFYYLSSITAVNMGLLLLLCYSFPRGEVSPWLPVLAVPYFVLYARDLAHFGYRPADVIRVYALNLVLVPVNLAGVVMSLHQASLSKKIPFGRTPKVANRTLVPPRYIVFELGLFLFWAVAVADDVGARRLGHAAFGVANLAFLAYAIVVFIGVREAAWDVLVPLTSRSARLHRWVQGGGGPAVRRLAPPSADPPGRTGQRAAPPGGRRRSVAHTLRRSRNGH